MNRRYWDNTVIKMKPSCSLLNPLSLEKMHLVYKFVKSPYFTMNISSWYHLFICVTNETYIIKCITCTHIRYHDYHFKFHFLPYFSLPANQLCGVNYQLQPHLQVLRQLNMQGEIYTNSQSRGLNIRIKIGSQKLFNK